MPSCFDSTRPAVYINSLIALVMHFLCAIGGKFTVQSGGTFEAVSEWLSVDSPTLSLSALPFGRSRGSLFPLRGNALLWFGVEPARLPYVQNILTYGVGIKVIPFSSVIGAFYHTNIYVTFGFRGSSVDPGDKSVPRLHRYCFAQPY